MSPEFHTVVWLLHPKEIALANWSKDSKIRTHLGPPPSWADRSFTSFLLMFSPKRLQSHPQLAAVFALAPSLHSFWSYFSTDLQQCIGHLLTWGVHLLVSYLFFLFILFMGFSRQAYCSGLPFCSPGDLPNRSNPRPLHWQANSLPLSHQGSPRTSYMRDCLGAQSYPTLCDAMDCSPPGPSVHGDSPGKNMEWVTTPSSRTSYITSGKSIYLSELQFSRFKNM